MKGIYRLEFLLSSFGPLILILAVKTSLDSGAPLHAAIILWALFVASLLFTALVLSGFKRASDQRYDVVDLKPKDTDIFPYIMSYVPSLIFRDLYTLSIGVPLAILYLVIFVLYFRVDSPYVNPYLALLGYRIHEARMKVSRSPIIVISRGRALSGNESLTMHEVAGGHTAIYYYEYNKKVESS